jgi:tetratricopeptide (TPR) repeat protein
VDAELARAEGYDSEAAAAYHRALESYGRLQTEYPGWQAAMVSYRIAECQNALAAMDAGKGAPPVSLGAGTTNTEARLQSLLIELRDARTVLQSVPESVPVQSQRQLAREKRLLQDQLDQEMKANQSLIRQLGRMDVKLNRAGLASGTNTQCKAVALAVKNEARRLMDGNETVAAISLIKEALDMMPAEMSLRLTLAMAQCRIGKFSECIMTLRPGDGHSSTNTDVLLTLGTAYMGLGEIGEARAATERAIKLNPNFAEAQYNMAQILMSLLPPDTDGAQMHYRRALELGLRPDADFENTLRMNRVLSKIKKHNAQSKSQSSERTGVRTSPAPAP